jgi:hypothetical protein
MGIFSYGVYLGGNGELGYGRAVYFCFRSDEWRLHYLCQIGVGLPAMPALVQSMRMNERKPVLWGFMAPPKLKNTPENDPNFDQPDLDKLQLKLNRSFELATFYTMTAGLLNILVIYDAFAGPMVMLPKKKEEEPLPTEKKSPS